MIRFLIIFVLIFALRVQAEEVKPAEDSSLGMPSLGGANLKDEPTFIDADSLTLNSKERTFVYTGNVVVKNGEMTLTSETLDGTYSEQNEIQTLTANKNVVITKGEKLKAYSNKAFYEAKTEIVTLSENPQIDQDGSLLTADIIKLYLAEDRSVAEGQVRMKVVKAQPSATPTPDPSASPIPSPKDIVEVDSKAIEPPATPTPTESGFWPF